MGRELKRVRRIFGRLAGGGQEARRQECRAVLRDVVQEVLALLKPNMDERIRLCRSRWRRRSASPSSRTC